MTNKNIQSRIGHYGKNEHPIKFITARLDYWLKGKDLEFTPVKYAKFGKMALSIVEFDKDHCIYILLPEDVFTASETGIRWEGLLGGDPHNPFPLPYKNTRLKD